MCLRFVGVSLGLRDCGRSSSRTVITHSTLRTVGDTVHAPLSHGHSARDVARIGLRHCEFRADTGVAASAAFAAALAATRAATAFLATFAAADLSRQVTLSVTLGRNHTTHAASGQKTQYALGCLKLAEEDAEFLAHAWAGRFVCPTPKSSPRTWRR